MRVRAYTSIHRRQIVPLLKKENIYNNNILL